MKITSFSIIAFSAALSLSSFAARQSAINQFGKILVKTTSQSTYDKFSQEEFEEKKQMINKLATISNFEADGIDTLKRKIKEHTDLISQIITDTGVSKSIRDKITEQYRELDKEINEKLANFSQEKANLSERTAHENMKAIIHWFMSDESRLENPEELFRGSLGATLDNKLKSNLSVGLITFSAHDNNKNSLLLKELFSLIKVSLLKARPTKKNEFPELTNFLKKLLASNIGYTHLKSVFMVAEDLLLDIHEFMVAEDLLLDIHEEETKPTPPPRKPKSPVTTSSETSQGGGASKESD